MSKTALAVDELLEEEYADDLADDDYCFIFDSEGNLKGAVLPDVLPFKAPKNIARILKLIGVRDIQDLDKDYNLH
jgi:hypothetical protein